MRQPHGGCSLQSAMQIYREREVLKMLSVSRTTLRRWMSTGNFPRPRQLGPHAIGWTEQDIKEWIDSRPIAGAGTTA